MRLLILTSEFPPAIGGVETHVARLTSELAEFGHEVTVVAPAATTRVRDRVRILPAPRSGGRRAALHWLLRHRVRPGSVDILHSHDLHPMGLIPTLRPRGWVHTFHGYEGFPLDPDAIAARQGIAALATATLCVGAFIRRWYGTDCDTVIWGAVDPPEDPGMAATHDVVFVGRLAEDTGVWAYAAAIAELAERGQGLTALFVGDGPLRHQVEQRLQAAGVDATFVGTVPDARPYMGRGRVALVSGYLTILEAAVLGRPIIAVYGTPIKEDYLRTHPLADYVRIAAPPDVTAALAASLRSPDPLPAEAIEWAQSQTWRRLARLHEDIYEHALDRR